MNNESLINNSGNSSVNITINIDTKALAYVLGSYLHATKQLDDEQYFQMMSNVNTLIGLENQHLSNLLSNKNLLNFKTIRDENNLETLRIYYD